MPAGEAEDQLVTAAAESKGRTSAAEDIPEDTLETAQDEGPGPA